MTAPLVVVTQDIPLGRTCVSWYVDTEDWERGYPIATVDPTSLWIERKAPLFVAQQASGLFMNELRQDRCADLSWLATHMSDHGLLVPVPEVAA